jgi:hypothetical protein
MHERLVYGYACGCAHGYGCAAPLAILDDPHVLERPGWLRTPHRP